MPLNALLQRAEVERQHGPLEFVEGSLLGGDLALQRPVAEVAILLQQDHGSIGEGLAAVEALRFR